MLSRDQIEHYRREGYVSPLTIFEADEAASLERAFHRLVESHGWPLDAGVRHKPHLLLKWLSDVVHHPAIVAAVVDLLGPDVLAWRSSFFVKAPGDESFVPWHQDSIYWGLEPPEVVTAWVALTDSTETNGCVRVAAGSHLGPEVAHARSAARHNALLRGQSAAIEPSSEQVRILELRAGQVSLHHVRLLHSSPPNPSQHWRAGFVIRYLAGHVRRDGRRDSATLVHGSDAGGHFEHEPIPVSDGDPVAVRCHRRAVRRYTIEVAREMLARPSLASLATAGRIALNPRSYRGVLGYLKRAGG